MGRSQKVFCTCCKKMVSYPTRRRHAQGQATTAISLRDHAVKKSSRKRPRSSSPRDDIGKKRRQIFTRDRTPDDDPSFYDDTVPMDSPTLPMLADKEGDRHLDISASTRRSNRVAGRAKEIIERRWGDGPLLVRDKNSSQFEEDDDVDEGDSGDWEDEEDSDDNETSNGYRSFDSELVEISFWDSVSENFLREVASQDDFLDDTDLGLLRKYALKVESHLTEKVFQRLSRVFPDAHHDTLKIVRKRVQELSGFRPVRYSCCINSCVCFAGPYEDLVECPNCQEARLDSKGKPRKTFEYLPLIPRLRDMSANSKHAEKMRYRANFEHDPGIMKDVFDGTHYRSLLGKIVPTGDDGNPFFYFSDKRDVALGLSTDGFAPFKRRDKTCWPIIIFNYNLPPEIRFQKKYCISVGTIPGPKKPYDMDSYLWPLVQELIQLEVGVKAFDAVSRALFILHAYLIIVFGDIPAMALLMRMKGANAIAPCRVCDIKGVRSGTSTTYYVPLRRDMIPRATPDGYNPSRLPIRTHRRFMEQAKAIQMAPDDKTHEELSKRHGIKGIPVLSSVSSVSFPESFPFDFMHLVWENLIPNLILFWTGEFKDLDHQGQDYVIPPRDWRDIGTATAACRTTIPYAFGAAVPNVATQRSQMTAEMYSVWTLFIAPIVLRDRFPKRRVYKHFMELVALLKLCMALQIDDESWNKISDGFISWVQEFERIYFQMKEARLSACPLTIHALLHIAWGIKAAGPVWAYWAFPMERHCNTLLPSIRSRRHPYTSINNFIVATAQLDQIRLTYNLDQELCLDPEKKMLNALTHELYPSFILSSPRQKELVPPFIREKVYASLATRFNVTKVVVRAAIDLARPVIQYGRVTCHEGGDLMVAREMVLEREDTRDASYIKYVQLVDRFANQRSRIPEFIPQVSFGQLLRIIILELPPTPQLSLGSATTIIFAVVQNIKVSLVDNVYYYRNPGAIEVVDLCTVRCVIGRVWDRERWGIVDRSDVTTNQVE